MIHSYTCKFEDIVSLQDHIQYNQYANYENLLIQIFFHTTDNEYMRCIQKTLAAALPQATIIGTTTDGTVSHYSYDETIISFTQFEKSTLKHTFVPFVPSKEDEAAKKIIKNIITDKTKVVVIFADGLVCNAEKLTRTINQMHPNVVIAGGLAGDNTKLQETFVCDHQNIASSAIVAVAIDADFLCVHNEYNLAWESIGKEMVVTKAEGNIIYEIDGEKAAHIFEKHLKTKQLDKYDADAIKPTVTIEFPLIIKREGIDIARTTMQSLEDGSLFCTGEFQNGDVVTFSYTNTQKIIDSGVDIAWKIRKNPAEVIFIYSCMARRQILGKHIKYDIEPLRNIAPFSGFYGYGEIFTTPQKTEFLSHTMTVLALSEEDEIYANKVDVSQSSQQNRSSIDVLQTLLLEHPKKEKNLICNVGAFEFHFDTLELFYNTDKITLTRSERLFLELLFREKNKSLKTEFIFDYIWGDKEKEFSEYSLRNLVKKLRKKLPENLIETVYGGYYKIAL